MSYCVRCGKRLDDDSGLCEDCREQQQNQTTEIANGEVTATEEKLTNRKYGFGIALASDIMSVALTVMMMAVVLVMRVAPKDAELAPVVAVFVFPLVVSLILGIMAIKTYLRNRKEGDKTHPQTLVMGIVGVVCSALALNWWIALMTSLTIF